MGCLNTSDTPQTLVEPSFALSQHMYLMSQQNTGNSFFFIFNRDFYPHKRWYQEGPTNHAENRIIERCDRGSLACLWGRKQKKDLPSDSAWRPIRIKEPDLDDQDIWNILQSGNDSKFLRPPPYFCSPNLHFRGISFASIISLWWDIWKYGPFI